jgi:butyryl-CoA dehydrogenase
MAGATPYLRLFGTVLGGWVLARQAIAGDADRQVTARYYCEQVLPMARALVPAVTAGADVLFEIPADRL